MIIRILGQDCLAAPRPTRYCECCGGELMLRTETDEATDEEEFEFVCRNEKCPTFSEGQEGVFADGRSCASPTA